MIRTTVCLAIAVSVVVCACAPGQAPTGTPEGTATNRSPVEIFETVWSTFDQRYALFGARSVDWQALYDVYRPEVTAETTDEQLFDILTAMLSHLNDNHVMLQAEALGRDSCAGYLGPYIEEMGLDGAFEFLSVAPGLTRSGTNTAADGGERAGIGVDFPGLLKSLLGGLSQPLGLGNGRSALRAPQRGRLLAVDSSLPEKIEKRALSRAPTALIHCRVEERPVHAQSDAVPDGSELRFGLLADLLAKIVF